MEHLRFDDLAPRDADQVQPVGHGDDAKVVNTDDVRISVGAMLAQRQRMRQVGRAAGDVLRVREQRRKGQLRTERARDVRRCARIDGVKASVDDRPPESAGERAVGPCWTNREGVVTTLQCLLAVCVDPGAELDMWRYLPRIDGAGRGDRVDEVIGEDDLVSPGPNRLPRQLQQGLVSSIR